MHHDARVILDVGLDLDLPLVGRHVVGLGDLAQEVARGRARLQQLPVGAVAGEAVAALGGAHDQPARLDDLGRRGHALDRLVEVLVERIAGVAGHDDVEGLGHGLHREPSCRLAGGGVHRAELAREGLDHLLLAVEDHVEAEVRRRRRRPRRGCPCGRGCPRARPRWPSGRRCAARRAARARCQGPARPGVTSFGPPLKPAKKCGSTKPVVMRRSACDPHAVDPHRHAVAVLAEEGQRGLVARVVVDDPHALDDVVAEHRPDLLVGVAAVRAGGDEDHDVVVADAQLVEDGGDHLVARLGAGAVAHRDRDLHARAARARAAAGRRPGAGARRAGPRPRRRAPAWYAGSTTVVVVRELDLEAPGPIGQPHLHRRHRRR